MAYYGLIEVILTFGLVIAFVIWQMADLRKARREREAREAKEQGKAESGGT